MVTFCYHVFTFPESIALRAFLPLLQRPAMNQVLLGTMRQIRFSPFAEWLALNHALVPAWKCNRSDWRSGGLHSDSSARRIKRYDKS
jgi:hypothetical protein